MVFLGTAAAQPTARRSTASLLIRHGAQRLLIDCGEGTQRQMQRSTGLVALDTIFLTHYHADHYLGLPGLLKTYNLCARGAPLQIAGPPGLVGLFDSMRRILGRTDYPIELIELEADEPMAYADFAIRSFPVKHSATAYGYALVEPDRPGRLDAEKAIALGVSSGPAMGALQRGETVAGRDGPVRSDQVIGPARAGRKLVVSGDTAPCSATAAAAAGAQLLIHEATFVDSERDRAEQTGHSTARQAALLAADAGVEQLALVHISSRHHVAAVLEQAREEFAGAIAPRDFDLIELLQPERGGARLVAAGALPPKR